VGQAGVTAISQTRCGIEAKPLRVKDTPAPDRPPRSAGCRRVASVRHHTLLAGAALAAVLSLAAGPGLAQAAAATSGVWKGPPEFPWGDFTIKPRGRVFADYVDQDVDRAVGADFSDSEDRFRTARIGVQGSWTDRWSYVAEANFIDGESSWEDLYVAYE